MSPGSTNDPAQALQDADRHRRPLAFLRETLEKQSLDLAARLGSGTMVVLLGCIVTGKYVDRAQSSLQVSW